MAVLCCQGLTVRATIGHWNCVAEQEQPFDADEVVAKATEGCGRAPQQGT